MPKQKRPIFLIASESEPLIDYSGRKYGKKLFGRTPYGLKPLAMTGTFAVKNEDHRSLQKISIATIYPIFKLTNRTQYFPVKINDCYYETAVVAESSDGSTYLPITCSENHTICSEIHEMADGITE